jgi:hypothetical protein
MAEHQVVVLEMTSSGESLEQLFFEMTAGGGLGDGHGPVPAAVSGPPPSRSTP